MGDGGDGVGVGVRWVWGGCGCGLGVGVGAGAIRTHGCAHVYSLCMYTHITALPCMSRFSTDTGARHYIHA